MFVNVFYVLFQAQEIGCFRLGQLCLTMPDGFEFLSLGIFPRLCYQVSGTLPSINLHNSDSLIAGLLQDVSLVIDTGSFMLAEVLIFFLFKLYICNECYFLLVFQPFKPFFVGFKYFLSCKGKLKASYCNFSCFRGSKYCDFSTFVLPETQQ